jgi:hypothetical protein
MSSLTRILRPALAAGLLVAAALVIMPVVASAAPPQTCASGFTVLHDDTIGSLTLPAGTYTITVADPDLLSCADSSAYLKTFLKDFDGELPFPWTLDATTATFSAGNGAAFQVLAGGTPNSGPTYPKGRVCPATFHVLHNDRIGKLRIPAGQYRVTLAPSRRPTCAAASRLLADFLQRPSGKLPSPWKLNPASATFSRPSGSGFRIKPVQ